MKKTIFFAIFVLCGLTMLNAQSILPGYNGFWKDKKRVSIIDLIPKYPDQLPFLRNEIYARYGRPFVNQVYQDYFKAQSWYQEKSNFSESWLTQNDKDNAEFIAALEQSAKTQDEVAAVVLKNIEYTDGKAVLTFTSKYELLFNDKRVDFGAYSNNWFERTLPWAAMGDWILVYQENYSETEVVAYRVDHAKKRILSSYKGVIDSDDMNRWLNTQNRKLPK